VKAPVPQNEAQRLAALRSYSILDTEPEPAFDRITAIASRVLGVPIALVSLIDSERQWFKAKVGLEGNQTPREDSFCAHAIMLDEPMIVPDAERDRRFVENPFVTGAPKVRFYAGAPLQSPSGHNLGTLCAIDAVPREFSPEQVETLRDLAFLVVEQLELRSALRSQAMAQTALSVAEAQLRRHFRMLNGIVDGAGGGIAVVDAQLRPIIVNPAGQAILGLSAAVRGGEVWTGLDGALRTDGSRARMDADELPIARALRGQDSDHVELLMPREKGDVWLSVTGRPLRDDVGGVCGAIVTFNDITKLREAQASVAAMAMTDELTGLPNRRAFGQLLSRLVAEGQRGRNFALVMVDIDHFKQINDSYGHPCGDRVLVVVGHKLARRVRRTDFAGRFGGEEFCILYTDVDESVALRLAEELRVSISGIVDPRPVTASFGVCVSAGAQRPNEEELIRMADTALYRAKHLGRNRVCAYR
jgi:diguanylate cyclase (GGDEF)-like protein/PAS domain S-box-containing protein